MKDKVNRTHSNQTNYDLLPPKEEAPLTLRSPTPLRDAAVVLAWGFNGFNSACGVTRRVLRRCQQIPQVGFAQSNEATSFFLLNLSPLETA